MKPWLTQEWQKNRARLIGDMCAQCGSPDGPFVMQHFSHVRPIPPSKKWVVWDIMREYDQIPETPTVQRPACPACNRRALTERKRVEPKWRCLGCHHEFDNPIIVAVTIDNRTERDAWLAWREETSNNFLKAQEDLVEQRYEAAIVAYQIAKQASYDKYISLEGTTTFCQTCAFLWDMEGKKLCGLCRKEYHIFEYQTCYSYSPEPRKTQIGL